jgi:hypothetical protein
MISSQWRGPVRNREMNALHAEGLDGCGFRLTLAGLIAL